MLRKDRGWSSDRTIPLPRGGGGGSKNTNAHKNSSSIVRNPITSSPLSPLASGRTLPSKWDDAERWICSPSPVSSHHIHDKNGAGGAPPPAAVSPTRRPKSKSGPLGQPPGSLDAAVVTGHVNSSSSAVNYYFSPFNTGVMAADEVLLGLVGRDAAVLDERFDGVAQEDDRFDDPCAVSRRDMATQMSPRSSICSSPKARASFSQCLSPPSRGEFPARMEAREVALYKRATIRSWSKRHASRISGKPWWTDSRDRSDGFSRDVVEDSAWQFRGAGKNKPWVQREEARITAWENLQKAKAEAAIQKLEMKLEKKRSSSMERILGKLKAAETKAREMRGSLSQDDDDPRKKMPIQRWFRCDAF